MTLKAELVFKTQEAASRTLLAYDTALALWPTSYEELDLPTSFGLTHVIASGSPDARPIILLHGQFSTATSWIQNICELARNFRYRLDVTGTEAVGRVIAPALLGCTELNG